MNIIPEFLGEILTPLDVMLKGMPYRFKLFIDSQFANVLRPSTVVKEIMDRIGGGKDDQEAVALVDRLIA